MKLFIQIYNVAMLNITILSKSKFFVIEFMKKLARAKTSFLRFFFIKILIIGHSETIMRLLLGKLHVKKKMLDSIFFHH